MSGKTGYTLSRRCLWPIYNPSSIYQNFPGSGSTFTQSVNFHPFLFGRFPVEKYVSISSERPYPFCDRVAPQTGFLNCMEEVGASTQQRHHFSRGTLSDRPGTSFPPEGKIITLQFLVNKFFQISSVPARQFLQLIGFLISMMAVIPLGRLHIRPIQWYLREFWHPVTQMWEACIPVLPRLLPHLQWWLQRSNLLTGVPLDPPDSTMTLYTDASLTGWSAFLEGRTVSGMWEDCHLEEHINLLEMRAVLLSLRHFQEVIQRQSLLIATDNTTVVAYLQNQGGTHSFSLYLLCREIMLLCDSLHTVLTVRHIPGNQNLIADALYRFRVPVNTEWELHPGIFQAITLIWDRPLIDLFATSLNYKLETFVSPIPDQKA